MIRYVNLPGTYDNTSVRMLRIVVLPVMERPSNIKPCRTSEVSYTWIILRVNSGLLINYGLFFITVGILLYTWAWLTLSADVCLGKISFSSPSKRGISSNTSLDIFMSLRDLISKNSSKNYFFYGVNTISGFVYFLLVLPAVLRTDKMFLRPKS